MELCRLPGNTVAPVCREHDAYETAVRRWVYEAKVDAGVRPGVTSCDGEELGALRGQLLEVAEERDILVRAVHFFAKGTR